MTKATALCSLSLQKASTAKNLPKSADFKLWIESALAIAGFQKPCEVAIRLVDEAEGQHAQLAVSRQRQTYQCLIFSL
jgi:ssRNA-specific RNase YbeY (16S rRNA maturation enzyme)